MNDLTLTGLDGANPLGFLATLGAFRVLNEASPARMCWRQDGGRWVPVLRHESNDALVADKLTTKLHAYLSKTTPAFSIGKNVTLPVDKFRQHEIRAQAAWLDKTDTVFSDYIACFGSSSCFDKNEWTDDTAFRFVRVFPKETDKSGKPEKKPGFLDMAKKITVNLTKENVSEALFGPWKYRDDEFSMRWDPADDRRYALRWKDPSEDKVTNVRGANRLTIEALPLFPVMPTARTLETTGFRGSRSTDTFFTWPIWTVPITLDVCRSLLALAELQRDHPDTATLALIGVHAVFRSQRITVGKFRNFTPARQIAGSSGTTPSPISK